MIRFRPADVSQLVLSHHLGLPRRLGKTEVTQLSEMRWASSTAE